MREPLPGADGSCKPAALPHGRWAQRVLALLLLSGLLMGSCVLPQSIPEYQTQTPYLPAPVLLAGNASPADAIWCVDDATIGSPQDMTFSVGLEFATQQTLYARWFLNYAWSPTNLASENTTTIIEEQTLTPQSEGGQAIQQNGLYAFLPPTIDNTSIPLSAASAEGPYALEVVVSDDFDNSGEPPNRAAAPSHYAVSYKWVINYRKGIGACPNG